MVADCVWLQLQSRWSGKTKCFPGIIRNNEDISCRAGAAISLEDINYHELKKCKQTRDQCGRD